MSEIGHKLSIPRRRHYKTVPLPCQHLGTVGSVIQIYSEGLKDDMAYSSLPRDTGHSAHSQSLMSRGWQETCQATYVSEYYASHLVMMFYVCPTC